MKVKSERQVSTPMMLKGQVRRSTGLNMKYGREMEWSMDRSPQIIFDEQKNA